LSAESPLTPTPQGKGAFCVFGDCVPSAAPDVAGVLDVVGGGVSAQGTEFVRGQASWTGDSG